MKRFLFYIVIGLIAFGFQACGNGADDETTVDTFQQANPIPDTLQRDTFTSNGERVTGYDTSGMRNQ